MSNTYASLARHPLRLVVVAVLVALVAGSQFMGRASANLDNNATFELDRNIVNDAGGGEDWADVFAEIDTADKSEFIPDFFPGADSQPATGATKDVLDMDTWDCKSAGLSPPKNDMANAFFASYTRAGDDHQLIYFGLDRINSDNGNANVGFWILKENHDCEPPASGAATWTGGKHSKGDTLIVSEFTGGGGVSTIQVFTWCSDPAAPDLKCGSSTLITPPAPGKGDGPLQLVFTGADCLTGTNNSSPACATVNTTGGTLDPPWPYTGAGKPDDQKYERGAFFEGGIDATALNLDLVCAGTFIADTRSSQSTTAQLHDFALGQVDLCTIGVTTASSPTGTNVVPGTSVSDTATVSVTAGNGPTPTGTVKFFLCQPSEVTSGGCEGTAGTQIGSPAGGETLSGGSATSDSTTDTLAIGKYCWRAEYVPATGSPYDPDDPNNIHTNSTTECFTTVKQPSQVSTTSSPTGGDVALGTSVSDSATVTGNPAIPGHPPTGTVSFFLCQPADVTAGGCVSPAGAQIGSAVTIDSSGNATSASTTNTNEIGKYCWRAEYSGDSLYNSSSHTNSTTECFTTVKNPSTTVTTSSPSETTVVTKSSVSDTATVTGNPPVTGHETPTGTVTFFLCQPADVTAGGCESPAGAQVGTAKTLDSSGQATSDSTSNTSTVGKYCWRAEYSGDTFYFASSHTNSTTECFTTADPSTILTKTATVVAQITYTYTEKNDGYGDLSAVFVSDQKCVDGGGTVSGVLQADGIHNIGDVNDDGLLNAGSPPPNGETWTFTCTGSYTVTTAGPTVITNTAYGHGTSFDRIVTAFCSHLPAVDQPKCFNDADETDTVDVTISISDPTP